MTWECVIGLEIHVQLSTRTKLFTRCPVPGDVDDTGPPNRHTDAVVLGLPGTLPVLQKRAVVLGVRLARALGATVHVRSRFDRKSYFYADLPKNFQITQADHPLATGGELFFENEGHASSFDVERIHLEEDAGRLVHEGGRTKVDLDRAGIPLAEVVTRPQQREPEQAAAALLALRELVSWNGIGEARMERGQMRCDANLSVRRVGDRRLGTKVEVKNLNSARHLVQALAYEKQRQIECLENGTAVEAQTRGFDPERGVTVFQRTKESGAQYRYLPEPDLPPLEIDEEIVRLAEGEGLVDPLAWRRRWRHEGLDEETVAVLAASAARARGFDFLVATGLQPRGLADCIRNDLLRLARERGAEEPLSLLEPAALARLLASAEEQALSAHARREWLRRAILDGDSVDDIVASTRAGGVDHDQIAELARGILDLHVEQVSQYRAGKAGLLGWFVAKVMKQAGRGVEPKDVALIVRGLLDETSH